MLSTPEFKRIYICVCVQETNETLTYRMLDRCLAPDSLGAYLDQTVVPYMKEKELDRDLTLSNYIKVCEGVLSTKRQTDCIYSVQELLFPNL